jgi:heme/copper-type cytochrome/quinol oxidase subunit 2
MSEPDRPQTPPPPPPQYTAYPGSYPPPPPPPYAGYTLPPTAPKNGLGIAALVVAIIALVTVFGGIVLGVVAVILGFVGWGRAKRGEATNGGVAIAGIVLGFLAIIVSIAAIGLAIWGFSEVGGTDYVDCLSRAGNDEQAMQQCADEFRERVETEFSVTITPTP